MKRWMINTGFKVFVCVTLIGAAAVLPLAARGDITGYADTVKEVDTPAEYAKEFSEGGLDGENGGTLLEEIYLTDRQLAPLIEESKEAFKEHFGSDVPQNMTMGSFAYMDEEYGLSVSLEWTNLTETFTPAAEEIWYSAQFRWMDVEKGTATLSWISCHNGVDKKLIENYEKTALERFENQLGFTIPESYTLGAVRLYKFFLSPYDDTSVELYWDDPKTRLGSMNMELEDKSARVTDAYGDSYMTQTTYQAAFKDAALKDGTGKLTGLFKNGSYINVYNIYEKDIKISLPPVFTDKQKAIMLESAKGFAQKQNLELGELRLEDPCNLGGVKAMHYIFYAEGLNGTGNNDVSFFVAEDGEMVGYFY